ncbi:MAG: hypothetical protein NTU91_12320 [Chloroflexi bacterium]|nr:hypothetical protein [Chloroflexota bacterium]
MSELEDFVLTFLQAKGAIVQPAGYGVHEVLLPEDLARRLGGTMYLRLAFDDQAPSEATRLTYSHPLVECMLEAAWEPPACTRFYINAVRLEKPGLANLARQSLSIANAHLTSAPLAAEGRALYHYLQVNFKAALVSDEKREQLVTVWMHGQGGYAVKGLTEETYLPLESEPALPNLPVAPLRWLPGRDLGSAQALSILLERAAQAAVRLLEADIERLQARTAHFFELDRARLESYYDDIEADLQRRMARAQDDSRRATLEGKLEAARAERATKLADVEAKYRLRVELEPINVALIAQPKLCLQMQIKNRHASIECTVVWDPLRHRIEPLTCDVCNRPASALSLCAGGHLVCSDPACQMPQCVDCRRVYCRLCADRIARCAVCGAPVCQKSLIHCPQCGKGTCRQHVGTCHAAAQQPSEPVETAPAVSAPEPESSQPPPIPKPPRLRKRSQKAPRQPAPGTRPAGPRFGKMRLDVQLPANGAVVVAFVYKPSGRQIACRTWSLEKDGIYVSCECENDRTCVADHKVFMPAIPEEIQEQMALEIEKLRQEYQVAPGRVKILQDTGRENIKYLPELRLQAPWKDRRRIEAAQQAFWETYVRGE